MKLLISLLFLIAPMLNWEPDFENAKKMAKEQHKLILLNFSGSDWCAPCILLKRDYFENKVFTDMADKDLILVNADFPRKKKNALAPATVKRNDALAETYNKDGNFPCTLLLNADGKILQTWKGKPNETIEVFVEQIRLRCSMNK